MWLENSFHFHTVSLFLKLIYYNWSWALACQIHICLFILTMSFRYFLKRNAKVLNEWIEVAFKGQEHNSFIDVRKVQTIKILFLDNSISILSFKCISFEHYSKRDCGGSDCVCNRTSFAVVVFKFGNWENSLTSQKPY